MRVTSNNDTSNTNSNGNNNSDDEDDILWRRCEDLEPLVAEFEVAGDPKFEVLRVKEKFGGLGFYVNVVGMKRFANASESPQTSPFTTCEICGQPGTLRENGLIKTLCDEHDAHL
jgi:hypothetical protein